MRTLFSNFIYEPLYNALVFLIDIVPGHSAGLAVILLTLIIRFILFPLSKKAIRTQIAMRKIEPEVKKLRETVKDRTEQRNKRGDLDQPPRHPTDETYVGEQNRPRKDRADD